MTEDNNTDDDGLFHYDSWHSFAHAICPHCDREEEFGNELTAYAWSVGHIQAEHPDELPAFEGTDTSADK